MMAPPSWSRQSEGQAISVLAASSHLLTVSEWPASEQEWPSQWEEIKTPEKLASLMTLLNNLPS